MTENRKWKFNATPIDERNVPKGANTPPENASDESELSQEEILKRANATLDALKEKLDREDKPDPPLYSEEEWGQILGNINWDAEDAGGQEVFVKGIPVGPPAVPEDSTPAETKSILSSLVEKVTKLTGGAKEKVGEFAEVASEKYKASAEFLSARSQELGKSLVELVPNIARDFAVAGRGAVRVAKNPLEAGKAVVRGGKSAAEYIGYFASRKTSSSEKWEKLKKDSTVFLDKYNKLPPRQKVYITAALIAGAAGTSVMGLPVLAAILGKGALLGSRVLGGAGFALNRRRGMDARIQQRHADKKPEHWLADKSDAFKNTYAFALGTIYSGTTFIAGHYATEQLKGWLGHMFGHSSVEAPSHPAMHETVAQPAAAVAASEAASLPPPEVSDITPIGTPSVSEAASPDFSSVNAPTVSEAVAPPAADMPTVEIRAASGDNYEKMLRRAWEEMQKQNFDASKFDEHSDIHKLLMADKGSIGGVTHRIAISHGFSHDGENVIVRPGQEMTFDDKGYVRTPMDGSPDGIKAPEGAPVTHTLGAVTHEQPSTGDEQPVSLEQPATGAEDWKPYPDSLQTDTSVWNPDHPLEAAHADAPTDIPADHPATTPPVPEPGPKAAPGLWERVYTQMNNLGQEIRMNTATVYHDASGHDLLVYGGKIEEQKAAMTEYLTSHPEAHVVYGTDDTRTFRLPWHLENGKLVSGDKVPNKGILKLFSPWGKPPGFNELIVINPPKNPVL